MHKVLHKMSDFFGCSKTSSNNQFWQHIVY